MTKQDWVDVLSITSSRDWTDWLIIVASVISPIIVLASTIYAAKSARAAEKAANLSLEIYKEEKESREKSFLPIFEPSAWIDTENNVCIISLKNNNVVPISGIVIEVITPENADFSWSYSDDQVTPSIGVKGDFKPRDKIKIKISYDALNHSSYKSFIEFEVTENMVKFVDKSTEKII